MQKEEININKANPRRWIILLSVVIMTFMACLDGSIVNVALPVMSKSLNVSMGSIQWTVTSYLIAVSCIILICGRLGDIKGKSTVFKFGIILFIIGSFLCGISKSLTVLIISRIIQGIGAAGAMATSQAIITASFPPNERGRALGTSGMAVALGTMVGPPLGGFITTFKWEYIFLINIPIGIVAFFMCNKFLPKDQKKSNEKLDILGAILFCVFIISTILSLTEGEFRGYTSPIILVGFVVSLISIIIFIISQLKNKQPLLDLRLFKNSLLSLSIFCAFISFIAISCSNIIVPFYLQDVMNMNSSKAGLFMMIYPLILTFCAPLSGYLSDKIGAELPAFLGLVCTSAGLFLMATLTQNSSLIMVGGFMAFMALGNGLFQSPNNSLVMSTAPKSKLGVVAGVNALIRNLGMIFGVTLATTLLYNRMSHKIGHIVDNYVPGRNDVFIYGMKWVYIVAGSICLFGAILSLFRLLNKKSSKN